MNEHLMNMRYDDHADVLYVSIGPFAASISSEDDEGFVWCFLPGSSETHGVTILDFKNQWLSEERRLVELISSKLHVNFDSTKNFIISTMKY